MKKIMLILAITATGLVTMSSCSREHTCECVTTDATGATTSNKTLITGTKKKAKEDCDKKDSTVPTTDCTITSN